MGDRLVTIHAGPLWEVQLLRGQLEEEGIPAFVPDENTKRVDPFITGGYGFAVNLVVREADAERATQLLQAFKAEAANQGPEQPDECGSDAEEEGPPEEDG